MDPVKRFTEQQIEFEPEWETGFNLLIKLEKSTSSMIEWCTCDSYILRNVYEHLLKLLLELETSDTLFEYKYENKKLFNKDYRLIDYDITKQDVSIHAPLTRLLAALHKSLYQNSIDFSKLNLIENELIKIHALIEPSLRSLAMAAQTNVGLWRRNGYSLLSQVRK